MLGGERCGVEIPWVEARPAEERVDWVGDIRATAIARQGRTLGTPVSTPGVGRWLGVSDLQMDVEMLSQALGRAFGGAP